MKIILSLSVLSFVLLGNTNTQQHIRSDFHEKELNEKRLESIISQTGYEDTPLTKAYKGLCETMMARYAFYQRLN
jgi:hypothetical protein